MAHIHKIKNQIFVATPPIGHDDPVPEEQVPKTQNPRLNIYTRNEFQSQSFQIGYLFISSKSNKKRIVYKIEVLYLQANMC